MLSILFRKTSILIILLIIIFGVSGFFAFLLFQRSMFTNPVTIEIPEGATFTTISNKLHAAGVIKSQFGFRIATDIVGEPEQIRAGTYIFSETSSTLTVAKRLMSPGEESLIRITIPEGTTAYHIGNLLAAKFPNITQAKFLSIAQSFEGYLFPETYLFDPKITAEEVVETMQSEFERNITEISSEIAASGRTEKDIVIMASILEEEGKSKADREIISGILWKRLEEGMALQVDASLTYAFGVSTHDLTDTELKKDHPYNTYTRRGLPPGPISNPGLESLRAAVNPVPTEYWYYLTDLKGNFYYSKTFAEHVANKNKYLK